MMRSNVGWIGFACVAATLAGCGKSETANVAPPASSAAPASSAPPASSAAESDRGSASDSTAAATEAPDAVVGRFLEALRGGNREIVAALLTDAARDETVRLGYHINPPGDPSCTYEVGRVETANPGGDEALVSSTWTNDVGGGELYTFEVVWLMKRQPDGWRVRGFAVTDPEGQQPLVFNFENLQEVFETKEQVEQAQLGTDPPPVRQAQSPADQAGQPTP